MEILSLQVPGSARYLHSSSMNGTDMPSSGPIETAFVEALEKAPILDQDKAAVALGARLARLLDAARGDDEVAAVGNLAPKMLAVLGALGMTVAGRGAKLAGGDSDVPGADKLDELKERRAARKHGA